MKKLFIVSLLFVSSLLAGRYSRKKHPTSYYILAQGIDQKKILLTGSRTQVEKKIYQELGKAGLKRATKDDLVTALLVLQSSAGKKPFTYNNKFIRFH